MRCARGWGCRIRVVLFGPTGTAGSGVLQACIADARVTEVRAVTRRALPVARRLITHSPRAAFVYLSGTGADRRSRMMWARVKAEAEDQLAALPLARLVCARLGGILPARPAGFERWLLAPLLKVVPSLGIGAEELGRAMLAAVRSDTSTARVTLENRELKERAQSGPRPTHQPPPTFAA